MKLTKILYLIGVLVVFSACKKSETKEHDHEEDTQETTSPAPKSPRMAEMSNIGSNHVHIDYSAPSARGRTIYGGLVGYGQVWATGAHSATSINFNKNLVINGTEVTTGKYAFFTIPGKEKWTVIINKNWDQHLADEYDPAEDIVRFEVIPEVLPENVEQLKYEVTSNGDKIGEISMAWADIKISFPVESFE